MAIAHPFSLAAALILAAGCAGPGDTQTADLPPFASSVPGAVPTAPDQPVGQGEDLGDALAETEGVIRPAPGVDSEMVLPAPDAGAGVMPVIPPPGTPGGEPGAVPK